MHTIVHLFCDIKTSTMIIILVISTLGIVLENLILGIQFERDIHLYVLPTVYAFRDTYLIDASRYVYLVYSCRMHT